jgi:hypothetical protein
MFYIKRWTPGLFATLLGKSTLVPRRATSTAVRKWLIPLFWIVQLSISDQISKVDPAHYSIDAFVARYISLSIPGIMSFALYIYGTRQALN